MRGYVKYFPKKNKGNRANWKISENGLWNIKLNFATHNEKKKEEAKEIIRIQNIFISVFSKIVSSYLVGMYQCRNLLTWGPERATVFEVVGCIRFNAERPVYFYVVHFSIKVKFFWLSVIWIIAVCVLKSPSSLPVESIRRRTPGCSFR